MTAIKSLQVTSKPRFLYNESNIQTRQNPISAGFPLDINGQVLFIFKLKKDRLKWNKNELAEFRIWDNNYHNGIRVMFTPKRVLVYEITAGATRLLSDSSNTVGLSDKAGAYYWFSLDAQNLSLRAGIGEPRSETQVYQYDYPKPRPSIASEKQQHKLDKAFLASLAIIRLPDAERNIVQPVRLLRNPVTPQVAMKVRNTGSLTMEDLADGSFLCKSYLPETAQKLYDCIAGERFVLDDEHFPEFSKAIAYSIATPGCWCHEKLKEKSTGFNTCKPNPKQTYLRITLGHNSGDSPGIPYVMEIWPIGHFSPIHNHAGANAIIRVLHGNIKVHLFPFLCGDKAGVEPFATYEFIKGDITWISPYLNQTHQLENPEHNAEPCITMQCYRYDEGDMQHYGYFDYLDRNGESQQYEPDSDMDFRLFKRQMKLEWAERNQNEKI